MKVLTLCSVCRKASSRERSMTDESKLTIKVSTPSRQWTFGQSRTWCHGTVDRCEELTIVSITPSASRWQCVLVLPSLLACLCHSCQIPYPCDRSHLLHNADCQQTEEECGLGTWSMHGKEFQIGQLNMQSPIRFQTHLRREGPRQLPPCACMVSQHGPDLPISWCILETKGKAVMVETRTLCIARSTPMQTATGDLETRPPLLTPTIALQRKLAL